MDKLFRSQLFRLPHVVGFGLGLKEIGGAITTQPCISILVRKKLSPEQLSARHIIPKTLDNVFTDVIAVGHLTAHEAFATETGVLNPRVFVRPACPGVSIGHYRVGGGTFGALVYDEGGRPLLLSNNHILANSSTGRDFRTRIGDPILQPGRMDGGLSQNNVIAKLSKYIPLGTQNLVDCAVAEPLSEDLVDAQVLEIGLVKGVTQAHLQQEVKKFGRTTGLTTGTVRALQVTVNISYGMGRIFRFEDQILLSRMSEPGDSGSLVVDANNHAVGLLFAGSDSATIVNPIQSVLDKLSVRF